MRSITHLRRHFFFTLQFCKNRSYRVCYTESLLSELRSVIENTRRVEMYVAVQASSLTTELTTMDNNVQHIYEVMTFPFI